MSGYKQGYQDGLKGRDRRGCSVEYLTGYREARREVRQINEALRVAEAKRYRDDQGNENFVSDGISDGEYFAVFRRAPGKLGIHRVRSKMLPLRASAVKAQIDLDVYAALKGWQLIQ